MPRLPFFWDFEFFNFLCRGKFKDFDELLKKPLSVEKEIALRLEFLSGFESFGVCNNNFESDFCDEFNNDFGSEFGASGLKNLANLKAKNSRTISISKALNAYNLSPIIVCEKIPQGKIEITAKSEIYFDTRQKIVKLA